MGYRYPVANAPHHGGQRSLTGTSRNPRRRSATIAVVLSFLWPGLGQAYQRRVRPALLFAVPMIVLAGVAGLELATRGPQTMAIAMLASTYAQLVMAAIVFSGLWRLLAMAEALLWARRSGSPARLAAGALVVLGMLVAGVHGYAGNVAYAFYEAGNEIFIGGEDGEEFPFPSLDAAEDPSSEPGAVESVDPSAFPQEPPVETPAPNERITVLLTGIDSTPTRTHALTDTLLVVSVDPDTGAGAMVSLPRDLARLPLYFGGTYTGKINSLLTYARRHPAEFPDKPATTLTREVGHLIGVPVQYYAAIDLNGFVKLVDLVGGVTVNNPRDIDDYRYGGWTDGRPIGFHLKAGTRKLDGQEALAFARSRMGAGDSDFTRARRQQLLLLGLREKLTQPEMLARLPDLLKAAGDTIKTNFPVSRLEEMLALATAVDGDAVKRLVLGPEYADRATDTATYELIPDMAKFAKASVRIFGEDSRWYVPPASPSPSVVP